MVHHKVKLVLKKEIMKIKKEQHMYAPVQKATGNKI